MVWSVIIFMLLHLNMIISNAAANLVQEGSLYSLFTVSYLMQLESENRSGDALLGSLTFSVILLSAYLIFNASNVSYNI